jgi:hypothetical protein
MRTIVFCALIGSATGVLVPFGFAACCAAEALEVLWGVVYAVAGANVGAMMGALFRAVRGDTIHPYTPQNALRNRHLLAGR